MMQINPQLEYLKKLGCKNPEKTLRYIQKIEETGDYMAEGSFFAHLRRFVDYTGEEGDEAVFLARTSCPHFDIWEKEMITPIQMQHNGWEIPKEYQDEEVEYFHYADGELVGVYGYNEDGYLHDLI